MTDVECAALRELLVRALPRLLTQLCRDPGHPAYGCFDRHHWHYKMRDFPSAVLVQGALVLDELARGTLDDLGLPVCDRAQAAAWRDATLRHWAGVQHADGSFDEYYPGESGFPAAGFSLYAAGLIARHTKPAPEVARAMERAAAWILRAPETEAINQEIVALTACTLVARAGLAVDETTLEHRWAAVHAGQSSEGWYEEYGGADTGYLAVACDALWDCWEATGDARAREAGVRAMRYGQALQSVAGDVPRSVNSRNTDYLSGYGPARFAAEVPEAAAVVRASLAGLDSPRHFLHHVDDRYLGHYVHTSWFRAWPHLASVGAAATAPRGVHWFPHARILVSRTEAATLYVAAGKGGAVVRVARDGAVEQDTGWRGTIAGRLTTTCWQERAAEVEASEQPDGWRVRTSMPLRRHGFLVPTPFKHLALRLVSAVAGRTLIPWLKRRLIFRQDDTGARFTREVRVQGDEAWVRDAFHGTPIEGRAREGAYSLRHVSSAGGFSFAEWDPTPSTSHVHRSE